MTPLRIGVIGCGRIAQVMHLPFLWELPEFDLVAASDLSENVLHNLGRNYSDVSFYSDYDELLARDDIDVVAITTADHASLVEDAARAGKHIFVEKPLCFTPEEGRNLREVVETHGVRAMVGYMRRFDPAVIQLLDELHDLGTIRMARAIDTHGMKSVPWEIYSLEMPQPLHVDLSDRLASAIGSDDPRLLELYGIVLNLGVHDLSVLRALLGEATAVTAVEVLSARHLAAVLTYQAGVRVLFEVGFWAEQTWNDTELELVADGSTARLSFPNPWVRYQSTTLRYRNATSGGTKEVVMPHSHASSYREEWLELYRAITEEREPITTVQGGLADVELAARIVASIRPDQLDAVA